ncbi:DUF1835 domain-containing protein [Pararobbsia alpina]|uniref:DUF1835 domain-containing protein n=1 Tax=Pararobbsia alpina TaxID=621374 RepID=UPI0039A4B531
MSFLHVVNGDSAAEVLGRALAAAGRDEQVVCLHDDLAIGPLAQIDDAPRTRAAFWQTVLDADDEELGEAFEAEAASIGALGESGAEVVVWHGRSAGDQLTLRRVAFHLRAMPERFNEVGLTLRELDPAHLGPGGQTAVALYSPDILRARLPAIAPVSVLRMTRLALEWQELKHVNSDVRRLFTDTFVGGAFCEVDALIIEHLGDSWQTLNRFIGSIMVTNTGFYATDTFVDWRIRTLVAAGVVAVRGDGGKQEVARVNHSMAPK